MLFHDTFNGFENVKTLISNQNFDSIYNWSLDLSSFPLNLHPEIKILKKYGQNFGQNFLRLFIYLVTYNLDRKSIVRFAISAYQSPLRTI